MVFWEPLTSVNSCEYARFSRVARGDYDGYIRDWAEDAAAYGGKVILRYAQEINGAYFPWGLKSKRCGNTPSDFKAAWRHVHAIFRQEGATNVKFLWSVSRRSCKGRTCNPFKKYYPGNSTVDYVGFSAFNWGRHSGHRWESMPHLVGTVMPYFKQFTKKPVIIAELATNKKGGNKPAWIRAGYNKVYKRWKSIKAIVYLNVDLRYIGHPDWSLGSPSGAYGAYRSVASKAKFKGQL
jgi:beta-mannanase